MSKETLSQKRKRASLSRVTYSGGDQSIASRARKTFGAGTGRPPSWTKAQLAMLGKVPDREVAEMTGRTLAAVAKMRSRQRTSEHVTERP